jgi:hypothetical protein
VVTVTGEVDEAAIVAACSAQLADYKVPRYVVIRREPLPRLPSGKIAKSIIRRDYADVTERYARVPELPADHAQPLAPASGWVRWRSGGGETDVAVQTAEPQTHPGDHWRALPAPRPQPPRPGCASGFRPPGDQLAVRGPLLQ